MYICPRCGKSLEFKAFPFQRQAYELRIALNQYLKVALSNDVTISLIDEWSKKLNMGLFNVISIFGEQGMGKTIVGFDIASILCEMMSYVFGHRNVGFSYSATISNIRNAEIGGYVKRSVFMTDEQESEYGKGKQREGSQVKAITNIARKWQPNLIYISPDRRAHHHHYELEVFDLGFEGDKRTHTRCLVIDGTGNYVGFFVAEYPSMFSKEFFDEYDKRKDEFIKNLLGMEGSERYNQKMGLIHGFFNDSRYAIAVKMYDRVKGVNQKVLVIKSVISGMTTEEYKEIVDMIEIERLKRAMSEIEKKE